MLEAILWLSAAILVVAVLLSLAALGFVVALDVRGSAVWQRVFTKRDKA